jgi:hypothetical protein
LQQPQIFISYRRDDAAGYARAVNDELARAFGAERVFIDVDDIGAGAPFSEIIERSVGGSAVLLALIGKRWRGERDGRPPRILEPDDFVRQEVAAGLANGLRVIPVLLDGAAMPAAAELPPDLSALSGRNALELDNTRFAADMARLVREVRGALGQSAPAPAPATAQSGARRRSRWAVAVVAIGAAVLALAALVWQWQRSSVPTSVGADDAPRAAQQARIDGEWRADVTYDWPNANYNERFTFTTDGAALHGSASFLGVPRGIVEGRLEGTGVGFVTRTTETTGGASTEALHRYRGRLVGDELRLVMQTEGGSSPHVPVEFVARRTAAPQAASR